MPTHTGRGRRRALFLPALLGLVTVAGVPAGAADEIVAPEGEFVFGDGIALEGKVFQGALLWNVMTREVAAGDDGDAQLLIRKDGHQAPVDLDLRRLAMFRDGDDLYGVLDFAAPVTMPGVFGGRPVREEVGIVLRPPGEGPGVAVVLHPDGKAETIDDPGGAAAVRGEALAGVLGTQVAFEIPGSLGVGDDWTAQGYVRITTGEGGGGDTGWVTRTVPVVVGAFTGASATIPMTGRLYEVTSDPPFSPVGEAPEIPKVQALSARLEGDLDAAVLVMEFDGPLEGEESLHAGFELVAPMPGGESAPIQIDWYSHGPAGATARFQGETLGHVPAEVEGPELRLRLGEFAPSAPSASNEPTTPDGVMLGRDELELDVTLDFTDAQGGFTPTEVHIRLQGTLVELEPSDGAPAAGVIDPFTGWFRAWNDDEYWAGQMFARQLFVTRTRTDAVAAPADGAALPAAPASTGRKFPNVIKEKLRTLDSLVGRCSTFLKVALFSGSDYNLEDPSVQFVLQLLRELGLSALQERDKTFDLDRCAARSSALGDAVPVVPALARTADRPVGPAPDDTGLDEITLTDDWRICPFVVVDMAYDITDLSRLGRAQSGAPCVAVSYLRAGESGEAPTSAAGGAAAPEPGESGSSGSIVPIVLGVGLALGLGLVAAVLVVRRRASGPA